MGREDSVWALSSKLQSTTNKRETCGNEKTVDTTNSIGNLAPNERSYNDT
jgi:hypothetical protein